MRRSSALTLAALLIVLPRIAAAQIPLYAEGLPDGYALIRFANGTANPISLAAASIDPVQLGTAGADRISSYRVVEHAALHRLNLQGTFGVLPVQLTPGAFQTYLLTGAAGHLTGHLVTDATAYNQLRAKLSFYNANPDCPAASLLLKPGGVKIFADVPSSQMRTRSVNPTGAAVQATCGAIATPAFDLGGLQAGGLYTVWLMAPSGKPETFLSIDSIAAYAR